MHEEAGEALHRVAVEHHAPRVQHVPAMCGRCSLWEGRCSGSGQVAYRCLTIARSAASVNSKAAGYCSSSWWVASSSCSTIGVHIRQVRRGYTVRASLSLHTLLFTPFSSHLRDAPALAAPHLCEQEVYAEEGVNRGYEQRV